MAEIAAEANLLVEFYDRLPESIASCVEDVAPVRQPGSFSPGFQLPEMTDDLREFLAVAVARWLRLQDYQDHRIFLLDLTRNPATGTTKTFASLLIVARAVEYLRQTGEPITIFSPTSANKGVALRDAVLRAYDAGLVTPDQLRIAVLAPANCRHKLRTSRLSTDSTLRAANPLLLYTGAEPEQVKELGRHFIIHHAEALRRDRGVNLWYSLDLLNYRIADTVRAFFEHRVDPIEAAGRPRVHAHAVSSAFGLLGYHQGRSALEAAGAADPAKHPASLLVQHLGTPDMVLNLRFGNLDRSGVPEYRMDTETGTYRQHNDPRFPAITYDPAEVLDPTFYTHRPATSPEMNALIDRYGGDGIVVSLAECLQRYPVLASWLRDCGISSPIDPRTLREWSLIMALTGALLAVDRKLIAPGCDIVVHGSGAYGDTDYQPIDDSSVVPVRTIDDVATAVLT